MTNQNLIQEFGSEWVLASGNAGKVREVQHMLEATGITVAPQSEYGIESVPETGTTFVENAIIKARHGAAVSGRAVLADDSGLVVPALNGSPGVHSARYAGDEATDAANNAKLVDAMSDLEGDARRAYFVCVLVLMRSAQDPLPLVIEGVWHGRILEEASGEGGFGYDPLFQADGQTHSAAELTKDQKSAISHRGQAMAALKKHLGV